MDLTVYLIVLFQLKFVFGARILGIVPSPSYSHQVPFFPLWKELVSRGHHLTLLTTDPMKDPNLKNLKEIDLHFPYDLIIEHNFTSIINNDANKHVKFIKTMFDMFAELIDKELAYPEVRKLIDDKNEHFDLVMVEVFLPAMLVFGHRFGCPVIGLSSMDAFSVIHASLGNPVHPTLTPDFGGPIHDEVTFVTRLKDVITMMATYVLFHFYAVPLQETMIKKYFGEVPPIFEMVKELDMLFLTVDNVFNPIRPTGPATVFIGGGLRLPSKPMPQDLQKYLDNATNGVIYLSLGSNVKSTDIPEKTRKVIMETFAELPYDILWKFEADDLEGKSDNVRIMKWVPQQDVLRHPNVKLFITQAGHQSTEESIFSHVPMVAMPFFGDQIGNAKKMALKGVGLHVDHATLTKETFKSSILEVMTNPKYRERVKELAELVLDEPMTGLEKAVWWTEYVIRHKGAKHLRSPAIDMPFYQYFLLDVIGFLLVVVLIFMYVFITISKFIFRSIMGLFITRKVKTN